jgi:hypothetical protein
VTFASVVANSRTSTIQVLDNQVAGHSRNPELAANPGARADQAANSGARADQPEANQPQVRSLLQHLTGFFPKPFSSSKTKRIIQTRPKSVYKLPAQPLKAADFKQIRQSIAIVDAKSPLPPRDSQIKRKRDLVSPIADTAIKRSVRNSTLDSFLIKKSIQQPLVSLIASENKNNISGSPLTWPSPPLRESRHKSIFDVNQDNWPVMDLSSPDNPWSDKFVPPKANDLANKVVHFNSKVKVINFPGKELFPPANENFQLPVYQGVIPHLMPTTNLEILLGNEYSKNLHNSNAELENTNTLPNTTLSTSTTHVPDSTILHCQNRDLSQLLGPIYVQSLNIETTTSPSSAQSNSHGTETPPLVNMETNFSLGNIDTNLDPSATNLNTKDLKPIDLNTLLGPKYSSYIAPPVSANNNTVSHQELDQSDTDPTNDDLYLIYLQNRISVLEEALIPWRQARSFLSGQGKMECRAEHLDLLRTTGQLPGWTFNLESLPGYLEREADRLVDLRRHQAVELLSLARDLLRSRARTYSTTGQAALLTCEILYRSEDPDDWKAAKDLLAALVGSDRAKCSTALRKRIEYLNSNPINDEDIKKLFLEGPKPSTSKGPQSGTNRSRSRSPLARNTTRGTKSRRPNRSPSNVPGQRKPTNNVDNNKTRAPKDNRGLAKNRGNNRSRAPRSNATNNPSTSTSNTSNQRNQGRQPERKQVSVTKAELAILEALRKTKDGQ